MWYPASVVTPPASEPVALEDARTQCNVLASETFFDEKLRGLIAAARAHVEAYCNVRFGTQTILARCDRFADLARLPEAPLQSVTSIAYLDPDGAAQTLSASVYEVRADGLEAAIVLKPAQQWPQIQPGSRIAITAVVGHATLPADVGHAMLLLVAHWLAVREAVNVGNIVNVVPHAVDALLCNHRRGA